ncbi:SMP-30/gluconolactonase/LRE family protein [Stagnihabitans tardus]|uniref:SMP-30/gluconolactonase/LRE family protein n=1 Tax=Stagnihabitans tardus TaxID=2699202 RepID=A0AAE5BVD4_9RHOB|nr:SMP-30/gluconolactonase/LRE family protein [Stagnihabitans tardus]NBZ88117.1 SMP-30/gluconolactonase/LRE family protein [Stagnihabitans tardus]
MSFYESHDPRFDRYVMFNAPLKQLATGFDWVEGPVWFGDAGCLLFSDIPNDRILRYTPGLGITTYRQPANFTNGHTRDRMGRLVSCQHGTRSVTRTEHDGRVVTLAEGWGGKRLNSPNDVIVASDGAVWFTDPHYGIGSNYEGHQAEQEIPCHVYRIDPDGTMQAMITDMMCPNGLCFSPDESLLYVADTGRMGHSDPTHIKVYDMVDGRPVNGRVFHVISPGVADGIRADSEGNIWSSARDGVHCIAPDGKLLGKILVPEIVSNLCFGGREKHVLYITATTSLYALALNRKGVQQP